MFDAMVAAIREETIRTLYRVQVKAPPAKREQLAKPVDTPAPDGETPMTRSGKKIGRNDPCPCGSGKKYKNCAGKDNHDPILTNIKRCCPGAQSKACARRSTRRTASGVKSWKTNGERILERRGGGPTRSTAAPRRCKPSWRIFPASGPHDDLMTLIEMAGGAGTTALWTKSSPRRGRVRPIEAMQLRKC